MRIAIVTDAWEPQVNGVVRTLKATRAELERSGHQVLIVSPDHFPSLPCPTYPEIRLALVRSQSIGRRIAAFTPGAIHLSTEGPLCVAARRWCLEHGLPFTTAYHTQFPDYVAKRMRIPAEWIWRYIRWFHAPAARVLVATASVRQTLAERGILHTLPWSRGVDVKTFNADARAPACFADLPRPILLYVGRIAVEKNIEAFLASSHAGTKVVVGDGPARILLESRYRNARFLGALRGEALAGAYAGADVFVFPSRTDTFGLVMIEALACGTPVAALPVSGPIDVVTRETGALSKDLDRAIAGALTRDRNACANYGGSFTWAASTEQFLSALTPLSPGGVAGS